MQFTVMTRMHLKFVLRMPFRENLGVNRQSTLSQHRKLQDIAAPKTSFISAHRILNKFPTSANICKQFLSRHQIELKMYRRLWA